MGEHFISRQPVINHQGEIVAYDLFYQPVDAPKTDANRAAAATLITLVMNTFGAKSVLGERKGFLPVDHNFLLSNVINSAPKEFFILSILDTTMIDDALIAQVKQLHAKGYCFAVHDITMQSGSLRRYTPLLHYVSYFKINIGRYAEQYLAKLKSSMAHLPIQIVATHVDTKAGYAMCRSVRIPFVQGHYFAEPDKLENKHYDAKHLTVIHLYNLLLSEASLDELVVTFESNHALTLQLLHYINSRVFDLPHNVSSIRHVLTLMGREPLARWLMLLIYGKQLNDTTMQSPLLLMVRNRTELMQGIVKLRNPNADKETLSKAFFIGLLSLSSTVMSMPLRVILQDMHVSEGVKKALLEREGVLGEIFTLVKAIEQNDLAVIMKFVIRHRISYPALRTLIVKSMEKVNEFEKAVDRAQKAARRA